jgi:hypothetical protein
VLSPTGALTFSKLASAREKHSSVGMPVVVEVVEVVVEVEVGTKDPAVMEQPFATMGVSARQSSRRSRNCGEDGSPRLWEGVRVRARSAQPHLGVANANGE